MPRAASSASLHAGIARLRKKWSLPPTKVQGRRDLGRRGAGGDHRGREVAQQHQRAGPVAVVGLVAHLQHLGEDPGHVDGPGGADGVAEQRAEHVAHPAQPVEDLGPVGAVPQHLAEPLVQRAEGPTSRRQVLEHEHPHRRRDDPRHRPHRGPVVARLEGDRGAPLEEGYGVLRVGDQALEGRGSHQRAAQRTGGVRPGDRRAGVQELAGLQAEQLRGRSDVDELGAHVEDGGERAPVGLAAQRVGRDGGQVGLGAGHRRAPVHAGDRHRLVGEGVGEEVGADVGDVARSSAGSVEEGHRTVGGRGVGEVHLGAGGARARRPGRRAPAGRGPCRRRRRPPARCRRRRRPRGPAARRGRAPRRGRGRRRAARPRWRGRPRPGPAPPAGGWGRSSGGPGRGCTRRRRSR